MADVKTAADACPICSGTGWRDVVRDGERASTRCECRLQGRSERLVKAARIPAR